jgi:hypothetical protein
MRLVGVSRHLRDIFTYSGFDQIFDIELAPCRRRGFHSAFSNLFRGRVYFSGRRRSGARGALPAG